MFMNEYVGTDMHTPGVQISHVRIPAQGLQIAKSKYDLHTLRPKVGIIYLLGVLGLDSPCFQADIAHMPWRASLCHQAGGEH